MPNEESKSNPQGPEKFQIKRRPGRKYPSSNKVKKTSPPKIELDQPAWSVISADECIATDLTYEIAMQKLQELKSVSGVCIVTNEAANRMKLK